MIDSATPATAVMLHLAAAACLVVCGWRGLAGAAPAVTARRWACRLAILMQGAALALAGMPARLADIDAGTALGCYTILSLAVLAAVDRHVRFPASWRWLAWAAAAGCVAPLLALAGHAVEPSAGLNVHFLLASLAYGFFLVALAQLVEIVRLAGAVPRQGLDAGWAGPPLLELERLAFRNVLAGFVLLTATNASGTVLYALSEAGMGAHTHHKTLFAWLSWLFVGILLACRWRLGWRGRLALRWFIAANVALVLSYFGTVIVVDLIL